MKNSIKSMGSTLLLILCLAMTTSAEAARGGFGGGVNRGFDNNNGFRDNNGYNNYNGYNYRHDDDVDAVYNPVVIDPNDDSSCETTQVCNSYGQCTTQEDCD